MAALAVQFGPIWLILFFAARLPIFMGAASQLTKITTTQHNYREYFNANHAPIDKQFPEGVGEFVWPSVLTVYAHFISFTNNIISIPNFGLYYKETDDRSLYVNTLQQLVLIGAWVERDSTIHLRPETWDKLIEQVPCEGDRIWTYNTAWKEID